MLHGFKDEGHDGRHNFVGILCRAFLNVEPHRVNGTAVCLQQAVIRVINHFVSLIDRLDCLMLYASLAGTFRSGCA